MIDNLNNHMTSEDDVNKAQRIADEAEGGSKNIKEGFSRFLIPGIAIVWSIFQLLIASVVLLNSTIVRSIHLTFAIILVFLSHPMLKKARKGPVSRYLSRKDKFTLVDYSVTILAGLCAFYIALEMLLEIWLPGYQGISYRQGVPLARDIIMGIALIIILLEAARRSLGPALPIVAIVFILYSFFAANMPGALSFKSVSLTKFISKMTMSTEGIFGVPLDVSANIVFLFVLFGAMLDKAGAGKYFVDLAFSLLGRFKGGPAKAAVLASGLTGMVSGSSIANTVTTGTFTIPLMKKVGYPAHKAGAVEVACSTNGQLMPPIMGAAAFIIAETCNLAYFEVIKAAFIPAVISYIALMYITHLEASKLGLVGIKKSELPQFLPTLLSGLHFMIPLFLLIFELVVLRHSASLAAVRAIIALAILIPLQNIYISRKSNKGIKYAMRKSGRQILEALAAGGKNMMGIGVAVAAAGIIVGVVTFGLGGIITEAIEILSGGNFILILIITAFASLILGMGLPTTATYIVMAALTAPVIVTLGAKSGVFFPLIAAHLFVFFFGILADDTPPVGLAAFAAAAIAKSDPIKTGIQGFTYDIRTAILPFMFMFNTDLLLYQITNPLYAVWVFLTALLAMLAFAALTLNFFLTRNKWYEGILLAVVTLGLLRPQMVADLLRMGEAKILVTIMMIGLYLLIAGMQKIRIKRTGLPA
ncbi:MAG: TRAP transporter permease [Spirochaetales bacterium]|nr:TRAP transporter permease [Spirochaetales bacterium]